MAGESTAIPHRQLRGIVAEHVRAAILDGKYVPGEWLRQQRLAEELGVSQMPVREALRQLATEGVVEHIPYRGARVIQFSADDVADLYAHRSHLESRAAREAAKNITAENLSELRELHAQMGKSLTPESFSEYSYLNRRFHRVVYTASQRDYLIRALDQIWTAFPTMMMSYFAQATTETVAERHARDLEEHAAIVDALERRSSEEAEELMRQHIDENCEELLGVLAAQQ
jgi:DNA-binding GntR family transcriptional regulator